MKPTNSLSQDIQQRILLFTNLSHLGPLLALAGFYGHFAAKDLGFLTILGKDNLGIGLIIAGVSLKIFASIQATNYKALLKSLDADTQVSPSDMPQATPYSPDQYAANKRDTDSIKTEKSDHSKDSTLTLKQKKGALIALYAFSALLLFSLYAIINDIYLAKQSHGWSSTNGVISLSEVRYNTRERTYSTEIQYQYSVNGQWYSNDRAIFGSVGGSNRSKPQQLVSQFPSGSKTVVYFSEDDPKESVLKVGLQSGGIYVAAFVVAIMLLGLVFCSLKLKKHIATLNPP